MPPHEQSDGGQQNNNNMASNSASGGRFVVRTRTKTELDEVKFMMREAKRGGLISEQVCQFSFCLYSLAIAPLSLLFRN